MIEGRAAADAGAGRRVALFALLALVPAPSIGVAAAMGFEPTRGTIVGQGIYAAAKLWILLVPLIWLVTVDRRLPSVRLPNTAGFLVGGASGFLMAAAILGTYQWVGVDLVDPFAMRAAAERSGIATPGVYLVLAAYIVLVNALLEEYVWRWFVFRRCETLVGGGAAVVLSALLFTLHHVIALRAQTGWSATLLASAGVFLGGCIWSWCYLRFRSVWPGYVSHMIADVAVLAVGWAILFRS